MYQNTSRDSINPTESDLAKRIRMMKYLHSAWWYVLLITAKDVTVTKWMVNPEPYRCYSPLWRPLHRLRRLSFLKPDTECKKHHWSGTGPYTVDNFTVDNVVHGSTRLPDWIDCNLLYQDNKSAISLQQNDKKCSSKTTRHLNIRYFFLTDRQENGNIEIAYGPTDAMISDCMFGPKPGQQNDKIAWER